MTEERPQSRSLPSVLRHHADEGVYVTKTSAALLREAADRIDELERGARSETGTLQAIRAYLDKEYLTSRPAHQVLDGLEKLLKDAK